MRPRINHQPNRFLHDDDNIYNFDYHDYHDSRVTSYRCTSTPYLTTYPLITVTSNPRKMRFLCLHGAGTSGEVWLSYQSDQQLPPY